MRIQSLALLSAAAVAVGPMEFDLPLVDDIEDELPAPSSTKTTTTTTQAPITTRTFTIPMTPRFVFGVLQKRRHRSLSADTRALCPTEKTYCIDSRDSDATTCMYPSPIAIKECLDDSCVAAPGNAAVFAKQGEDSYCKDYMLPEGRVCHWIEVPYPCTYSKFDITYVDALLVKNYDPNPKGWAPARVCQYPDNYKAENRRAGESDGLPRRQPTLNAADGTNSLNDNKAADTQIGAGLVATLLVVIALL